MACQVGYGAYRWEVVEHRVPIRVVGPDGRQYRQQSRACSRLWESLDRPKAHRMITAHVWMLNVAHAQFDDAADRFERDVAGCREVQDAFVAGKRISMVAAARRDGSQWLSPPAAIYNKVSDALVASGKITDLLMHEIYGGQDPSKVDKAMSRTGGGAVTTVADGRIRVDVDRRLRLKANPNVAPRYDDPRFFDRLYAALVGAPEAIRLSSDIARHAGARWCMVSALTLHDVLVRPKKGKVGIHMASPTKGSGGERQQMLIPGGPTMERVLDWIDGGLAKLTGTSLAQARLMAADPNRRNKLKKIPLITENGVDPVKYERMYKIFRAAAKRARLWVDDDEYRSTGRLRYVSFHYLRHEYVHQRLDDVAAMQTEAQQRAERKAIIRYMGWKSGEAMLEWYSAHHIIKLATGAAELHNERADAGVSAGVAGPNGAASSDEAELVDEMLEGLA